MPISKTLVETSALGLNLKTPSGASALATTNKARVLQSLERSYSLWKNGPPTLAAADTPSVFGEILYSADPTSDPTTADRTTNISVITGDAANPAWSALPLSAAQKANAFKYISGYNPGMRTFWNYSGVIGSNNAGGNLGDVGTGNAGNNYDATLNPTGLVFPANLTLGYADYIVEGNYFATALANNSLFQYLS